MSPAYDKVKAYILELGLRIYQEVPGEELFIVDDTERGIRKLIIDCEGEILVLEQLILRLDPATPAQTYRRLLQMNRNLVHGSFVLDEGGERLLFRDTLALDSLDLNELESTLNALSLGLAENGAELLAFAGR
ncbi:MAG: YbjN domain-containing protein [Candidatus Handelsmanbacteria bacterium]|nr:YbjN domain-containing protein [Candidatus Handelsmanbacteria bacterium]